MGFGAASGSRADVLFKYKTSSLDTSEPDGGLAKELEPDNTGFYHGSKQCRRRFTQGLESE
jgi:hypothetical protein